MYLRPQGAQGVQVQVNGSWPQLAAAGLGAHRLAAAAEDRPQKHHRRTHPPHKLLGYLTAADAAGIHHEIRPFPTDFSAQMTDDLRRRVHVTEVGTPFHAADAAGEHRGRQYGQHAVFRSLHRHRAGEPFPALHQNDAHIPPPSSIECTPSYAGGGALVT